MAYDKTTWTTGDVITAAKLNNMENGIAATSGLYVCELEESVGIEEAYNELVSLLEAGGRVCLHFDDGGGFSEYCMLTDLYVENGKYVSVFGESHYSFDATDPDDPMEE